MESGSSPAVLGVVAIVAVLALNFVNRGSRQKLLHEERMAALEKGVPLPEDLLVESEPRGGTRSLAASTALHGTIWTALGLGMLAAGRWVRLDGFADDLRQFVAFVEVWAYPATFVGVALLVFAFFAREKPKR